MSRVFVGKVVVITGASSGIGAELARQFAKGGARVALVGRDVTRLEAVAAACRLEGNSALVVPADIAIEASCRDVMEKTIAHFGSIDILVNNAGVRSHGRFDEITDLSIFDTVMRINFLSSVWCTAYALPHLKKSGGQIVAIASLQALAGVPTRSAYCASKHAMAGFFDSLRVELQDSGVAVTVMYPSFVESDHNQRVLSPDGKPFGERASTHRRRDAMSVNEFCRVTLEATLKREREVLLSWRAKVGRVLKLVAPSLIDRMAKAAVEEN